MVRPQFGFACLEGLLIKRYCFGVTTIGVIGGGEIPGYRAYRDGPTLFGLRTLRVCS